MEQYQDVWVHGECVSRGVRECESRYEMIASVAERFRRPFTVLDIGANLGYFSLRLAEDFDCTVLAVEGVYSDWLRDVLDRNGNERVIAASRRASLQDLRILADVEHFDLTLALSVTHHVGASYSDTLEQIRRMGMATILELPTEKGACGQDSVKQTFVPDDGTIIGHGKSHLSGPQRPLVLLEDDKTRLERSYWGTPLNDCDVEIEASWDEKWKVQRGERSVWHRGINLNTWLKLGPSWPSKAHVLDVVGAARPNNTHGDLRPHNVVFQGDGAVFIDALDPRRHVIPDDAGWREIVATLS